MKKKMLSILMSMALVPTLLVGCAGQVTSTPAKTETNTATSTSTDTGSEEAKDTTKEKDSYVFGYTCMDGTNPFFVILEKTIREQVEANGDKLISTDPANDVSLQITQIEDMISQGIDAIFLNPAEAEGVLPALDQLKEAGIPIINFDTEVAELEYVASYAGSDNYNAGYVCGEDLVAKCPEGGDIIVLDSPTMNSIVDRTNGFLDAIKDKGFNIVAQQDAKGNLEVSMGITEDLLQAHGNVIAIFGGNDPTALGALAAANAAGLKDVKIYGVDGSPDIKAELASGDSLIAGTGAQSPIGIANKSVEIMYKVMGGENVDARYPVETFLITSDNVNEFGTDGWQ
ncbi:substrate-binding domain-containing protein [Niameybacter massiliensis]|uniref:Substrate-binding domain-containing protein n=1 Tax=Holtiella tumoricola TaxID=3018743 RepID=A0AA42DN45_9FIRM|nr:substrate-binding domain-containing protein [Holtiella tumoricola]MDA3731954.1 substrate-binding domain-containing protein [Holtiella tumoricola]